MDILKLSPCYNAFLITVDVPEIYMHQFWFTISKVKDSSLHQFQIENNKFKIGVELFHKILSIYPRVPNEEFVAPPPHESLVTFIKSLGYKGSLEFISDMYIDHTYQPWRTFSSIINSLFMNSIKDDGVLGRLKFVSKGEDNQVYGISILDVMLNNDIKNSKAYQTYLAISTGIVVPNKARKGMKTTAAPKKKGSITADDNINHDPKEVLKLGKSISRTEAEEQEEGRRVLETHECLVTKKSTSDVGSDESGDEQEGRLTGRRPTGVVIRDTPNVSIKKILDQSQKLKGIEMLSDAAQLVVDTQKAIKANIRSSEGDGITSEVPDEPKGKTAAHDKTNDDWGFDEEEVILSSDDERTESEKETVKSEKADEETTDEDEHDDADDEMNNAENADEVKKDQEMADAEKNEKTKLPPSTSSLSLSSDYNNQFLNLSSDVSLVNTVKETTDTEINSLLDVQIQQEIPHVLSAPLLDVLVSVIPEQTTPTPILTPLPTPPTTETQAIVISVPDPSPAVLGRLLELEKKVEALSKVDNFGSIEESVQANVIHEVKNQLPKFIPKVASNYVNPIIESTVFNVLQKTQAFLAQSSFTPGHSSSRAAKSLSEYELKKILFDKMDRSRSYMTHDKHQELYNSLLNSMCLDDAISSGEINPDKVLRKRHRDEDQDPPTGLDKEKKRSRKGNDYEPPKKSSKSKESSKGKTPPKTSKTAKSVNAEGIVEEPVHEAAMDMEEPIRDDVVNDVDQP
ncbi:hypothetical protein Tco_1191064 [Tanacetum coccineum]